MANCYRYFVTFVYLILLKFCISLPLMGYFARKLENSLEVWADLDFIFRGRYFDWMDIPGEFCCCCWWWWWWWCVLLLFCLFLFSYSILSTFLFSAKPPPPPPFFFFYSLFCCCRLFVLFVYLFYAPLLNVCFIVI